MDDIEVFERIFFDEYSGKPRIDTKFNTNWILKKYMNISDEDMRQNEILIQNEIRQKKLDSL